MKLKLELKRWTARVIYWGASLSLVFLIVIAACFLVANVIYAAAQTVLIIENQTDWPAVRVVGGVLGLVGLLGFLIRRVFLWAERNR